MDHRADGPRQLGRLVPLSIATSGGHEAADRRLTLPLALDSVLSVRTAVPLGFGVVEEAEEPMSRNVPEIEVLLQRGTSPAEAGVPEPEHAVTHADGMRIERNRPVTMRDGVEILIDLYRPEEAEHVPAVIAWSPYGKHNGVQMYQLFVDERGVRGGGVRPEWMSQYARFEGPDPAQWCPDGYAIIQVDPRALWWSGGDIARLLCEDEARDVYDLIEWAGTETWCNGRVGMTGASYLAMIQWWAASLNPPHLAAINPCEGVTDPYREFFFHGGIPDSSFPRIWQTNRLKYSCGQVEAMADMMGPHSLDDVYWASKRADLERVEVPAYVVASWSDQGLHTRGTLIGYERISSQPKFLEVHGRKKWEYYHQPSSVARQKLFFDHFLKQIDNEVSGWPPVRMEVRHAFYDGRERTELSWPPEAVNHRALFLDAANMVLTCEPPQTEAEVAYDSEAGDGQVVFEHVFTEPSELIGTTTCKLWVSTDGPDMDLFIALRKLDAQRQPVYFPFANVLEDGPVALGWLRVSHRELDSELSTVERPVHSHRRELPLALGEVVPVKIEIWPSGTSFASGEILQLVVRGSDHYTEALLSRHADTHNQGQHVLHCGGDYDSHLLIPVAGAA